MEPIKVYYNSACPVCEAGIEGQRCALRERGRGEVEWIDVHFDPARAREAGADLNPHHGRQEFETGRRGQHGIKRGVRGKRVPAHPPGGLCLGGRAG